MTNTGPFLWIGSSKISFFNDTYLILVLSEAVEVSWCYFFETLLMKLKQVNLLKTLGNKTINLSTPRSHLLYITSLWDTLYVYTDKNILDDFY